MSMLSDYKRCVSDPLEESLRERIKELNRELKQAKAEGFRLGIEAAAKVIHEVGVLQVPPDEDSDYEIGMHDKCKEAYDKIRVLTMPEEK